MFEGRLFSYEGGGYFQFFTKNRPQKHQKRAILHTSPADGGARAPPGYAADVMHCNKVQLLQKGIQPEF